MKPFLLSYIVIGMTLAISGMLPSNHTGLIWFTVLSACTGLAIPFFRYIIDGNHSTKLSSSSVRKNNGGGVMALLNLPGPIGLIFAGSVADSIGVEKLFIIAGLGTILCAVINWLIVPARTYDKELQKVKE